MPYCRNCGTQVNEDQDVCLSCGKSLNNHTQKKVFEEAESTLGYAVLGFFIPVLGLLLYLIWKDERPKASLSAGKGALISVIISAVFVSIYLIFAFLMLILFGGTLFTFNDFISML